MKIRKIKTKDLPSCAEILEKAYSRPPYNEKFSTGGALKYIKGKYFSCPKGAYALVDGQMLVGFIFVTFSHWANGPQIIIEEMAVDPKFQGKGNGQRLLDTIYKIIIKKKIKSLVLWTNKKSGAYKFFLKNGFQPSGEHVIMFKNY